MTDFRLFQTERVCRRQFQIWRKWQKVIQMGRKHCGKRKNCSLRAISPFPTVFSNSLFPRGIKRCHCVGMGLVTFEESLNLTLYHRIQSFNNTGEEGHHKHCRKNVSFYISTFNSFPNKPWFLRVCSTSLLKTLWENEKLLVTSNFSFSHSVF